MKTNPRAAATVPTVLVNADGWNANDSYKPYGISVVSITDVGFSVGIRDSSGAIVTGNVAISYIAIGEVEA